MKCDSDSCCALRRKHDINAHTVQTGCEDFGYQGSGTVCNETMRLGSRRISCWSTSTLYWRKCVIPNRDKISEVKHLNLSWYVKKVTVSVNESSVV